MKVLLLKDVKDMGSAYTVKEVSDGYALNFLIPKRLATAATPAALKEAEVRAREVKERKAIDAKLLSESLAALAEARIVVTAKANEKGHLYDAVGEEEIRKAAKDQARVELPEGVIRIERPFKELGTFDVPVAAGEDFGTFAVTIEAEA
ncbi:MAG: 50S ribosomal protein L9 [Patescibacteria group bacterium]|nr:50S ribosomal protein L9 [Patescibacteria group bacterium]MDE1966436.1 50S ribosomal protein L9 [Patescibacteria group bacterium]